MYNNFFEIFFYFFLFVSSRKMIFYKLFLQNVSSFLNFFLLQFQLLSNKLACFPNSPNLMRKLGAYPYVLCPNQVLSHPCPQILGWCGSFFPSRIRQLITSRNFFFIKLVLCSKETELYIYNPIVNTFQSVFNVVKLFLEQ